jgi:hypothetical protein
MSQEKRVDSHYVPNTKMSFTAATTEKQRDVTILNIIRKNNSNINIEILLHNLTGNTETILDQSEANY